MDSMHLLRTNNAKELGGAPRARETKVTTLRKIGAEPWSSGVQPRYFVPGGENI